MDYLIPAWHEQIGDWAFGSPNLGFDDMVSIFHLFSQGQQNPGIVVVDYQPSLSTRLAQASIEPRKLFSVFDYIQDSEHIENQTVDFYDFNWPEDVFFEFTPFHMIVRDGATLVANIFFDLEDKIVRLDYFHEDRHYKTLIMDSRGFVSRIEYYDDNNHLFEIEFLDPQANWHIKYQPDSDTVDVNPAYQYQFKQAHYDHLNDLILEVLQTQFLDRLKDNDRLIATIDDQSQVPQTIYAQHPVIYEASKWRPYQNALPALANVPHLNLVCDTQFTSQNIMQIMDLPETPVEIPLYQAMFKLGHSQRLKQQQIYLFVDNTDLDQLQSIVEIVVDHMLDHPHGEELYLLSFGGDGADKSQHIFDKLDERHHKQFHIKGRNYQEAPKENDDDGENQALDHFKGSKKKKSLPVLSIKFVQLFNTADILKGLDKTRLLIDWGDHPDDFLQMGALSVGIPVLQRVQTEEIIDRQNGLICRDLLDLRDGLHYYLDGLKNWNKSLANDVQIMNEHSADKLLAKWSQVWQRGSEH